MRKIDIAVGSAFDASRNYGDGNTSVIKTKMPTCINTRMYLHGHLIAEKNDYNNGDTYIAVTTAGWDTPVTRARLNSISGITVKKFKKNLYLNGTEWYGEWRSINVAVGIE